MPGLLKSPDRRVAMCGPPQPVPAQMPHVSNQNGVSNNGLPQPRQPRNLQGLLRFAMQGTAGEDAAGPSNLTPMTEERRRFLEEAMKSMTVDVVEVLLKQISVFDNVATVTRDSTINEYTEAFYTILEYVDNMDVANDFYEIGGFTIIDPCLKSPHPKIRAGACDLLAELCQNNLFCQMIVIDNGFLPTLLEILDKDQNDDVCLKALYALSCIVRENIEGCRKFLELKGVEIVLKIIQRSNDKIRTKSSFFLDAICCMRKDIIQKMIDVGVIPVVMDILKDGHMASHEYMLSLMKIVVENNEEAVHICRNPIHELDRLLMEDLEFTKDKEEFYEEAQYCQQLLNYLFPGWNHMG